MLSFVSTINDLRGVNEACLITVGKGADNAYMSGVRDYDIEAEEREARLEQMRADTRLKNVQAAVEWPKTFTAIIIAVATVTGIIGAFFGYNLHH